MNFHYNVIISNSKETIEFKATEGKNKNEAIKGVEFRFNSDDNGTEYDIDGRVEIVIKGRFDGREETFKAIKQLSDWATSTINDAYREVEISMTTSDNDENTGNFKRTYCFDKMFCIKYSESSGNAIDNSSKGGNKGSFEFTLFMAQAATWEKRETKFETV